MDSPHLHQGDYTLAWNVANSPSKHAWDRIVETTMPLVPGEHFGHYQIQALIGKGGMGEVYCATDTQLKRDVALKILPAQFACEPERTARFQREAEVLASLNHPHIAALYGLAESDGVQALVMEFVEGPAWADGV